MKNFSGLTLLFFAWAGCSQAPAPTRAPRGTMPVAAATQNTDLPSTASADSMVFSADPEDLTVVDPSPVDCSRDALPLTIHLRFLSRAQRILQIGSDEFSLASTVGEVRRNFEGFPCATGNQDLHLDRLMVPDHRLFFSRRALDSNQLTLMEAGSDPETIGITARHRAVVSDSDCSESRSRLTIRLVIRTHPIAPAQAYSINPQLGPVQIPVSNAFCESVREPFTLLDLSASVQAPPSQRPGESSEIRVFWVSKIPQEFVRPVSRDTLNEWAEYDRVSNFFRPHLRRAPEPIVEMPYVSQYSIPAVWHRVANLSI